MFCSVWTACNFIMLHLYASIVERNNNQMNVCPFVSISHHTETFQNWSHAWKITIDYRCRIYWDFFVNIILRKKILSRSGVVVYQKYRSYSISLIGLLMHIFLSWFSPTDIILICHSLWCRHHSNNCRWTHLKKTFFVFYLKENEIPRV